MKKVRQLLKCSIPEKAVAIIMILAFMAALFPLFRLAIYAVPSADDYNYGLYVKNFLREYGNTWKSVWDGALYVVKTWWYCWQGTYSSIFFMAIVPSAFGEQYYYLGIIVILAFFTCVSYIFVNTVLKRLLHADWQSRIMVSVLVTLAMLELIYTAQQCLYWYNAAIHYTFMHGWVMLLLTAALQMIYIKNNFTLTGLIFFTMLAGSICGGSNFVSALQGFLALLCICVYVAYRTPKRCVMYLPSVLIYMFGLYKNMSAPGNAIRGNHYNGYGAVKSILMSFVGAVQHLDEFIDVYMLIILVVFVLFMWNTLRKSEFRFGYPVLVTLLSFCFYATGFTPSLYGMGSYGVSRTLVVVKFTLQILLFVNAAYWTGWYMQKKKKAGKEIPKWQHTIWVYGVCAAVMLILFGASDNKAGSVSSYGAYYYVHTGEAANFKTQYEQRIEAIKNGGDEVVVEPYVWKPWFLYASDITTDANHERNRAMADWYDKKSIRVRE